MTHMQAATWVLGHESKATGHTAPHAHLHSFWVEMSVPQLRQPSGMGMSTWTFGLALEVGRFGLE